MIVNLSKEMMMLDNWVEVSLGEVVDTISQKHRFDKKNIILVNTSDVLSGKVLNHKYVENKNLKGQFKKSFRKNDILFSEIRPKNKRFAYVDFNSEDYVASTKLMVLRKKNEQISSRYLYRFLSSEETINILQTIAESRSGTFPQITYSELARLNILLPPLEEQKAIAATLSCLDDKIELNNRMNQTLEEMAQAIFKSWFVDFEPFQDGEFVDSELGRIPKGWRVGTLSEIMEISSGKRPKSKSKNYSIESEIPVIGASDIMGYTKKPLINEKIIVIGRVGTHGIVQRFEEPCWPSDNTLVIKSEYYEFVYHILCEIDYKSINRGSTQPLITQTDVKNTKIIIPNESAILEYEKMILEIMKLNKENIKSSSKLKELRNTLLPKLMSGEVRVPVPEVK